jgi:phosphoribosylaminoimidazole carboxylase (NCAIR synthetase)
MTDPILPGATIGILGGGQLGRMTAMAARTLGYDVHVLDPDPECAARAVVDRLVSARFDAALAEPMTRLHLYGKRVARPGRKMGHISAYGDTADDALARARSAAARLVAPRNGE